MNSEEVEENNGIVKALGAYHHYSRLTTSVHKEQLLSEGKDSSLGQLVQLTSQKWKGLDDDERAVYEKIAAQDRARYDKECAIRDEEFLREQEERRNKNTLSEVDTRMRGTTIQRTDNVKVVEKKTRVISASEQQKKDQRRKEKEDRENSVLAQQQQLADSKAAQAENRLKYLLQQSEMFTHFGVGVGKDKDGKSGKGMSAGGQDKGAAPGTPISRRQQFDAAEQNTASDTLDEDERAMASEENQSATTLLVQPSCVSGGLMRPYQLEGLNWMIRLGENGINGILADEMGLGKTLQSISILGYLREFKGITGPHLVIVPKSTLSNWMNEFKRWCPDIRTMRFHGSKDERQAMATNVLLPHATPEQRSWDVCVTTYEVANLEKNVMNKMAWNYLIIDEAHRIKNEASQFSTNIRLLTTHNRLLLTGTPLQNNLHELWALLNYLLPDVFASAEQFDDWFNLDVEDVEAKQRMIGQLHKILRPFMLRRLKADVEKSLPPKSETILFTGMSAIQKTLYRQVLLRDIDIINSGGGGNNSGSRTAVLNIVMQLRKCCNHPYLFPNIEDRSEDPLGEHLYMNCGKMALLDKLLKKMKQRDHRVLIFSQMTRMLDILEDYLVSMGYTYCRIDGNTTYDEREDRIQAFNADGSEVFIFLLSTRAGGLGINLQTADTVILYDSDWNPQADLQAQDRAHRIGQKKTVQVFRLVTEDTVEEKVIERAQQKLKLDAMVVQQGRLGDKDKKLSKDELLDTLRFGADKIFRSKESTITDADIDSILLQGKKRTEEMNDKLTKNEKGDMYDFSLDGGMSSQVFEGKDYSDRNMRDNENSGVAALGSSANLMGFIDTGKRERKVVNNYMDSLGNAPTAHSTSDHTDKKPKLPRHLRIPLRMDDWQFYDKSRLVALQEEEMRLFDELIDRGQLPNNNVIGKLVLLPEELHAEKLKLLTDGFASWTKNHYNIFVRASGKYGRHKHAQIAVDIGRPDEEVQRYIEAFWSQGSTVFSAVEWERAVKSIEKGEKRLEDIDRLAKATGQLINTFANPWEELVFKHSGGSLGVGAAGGAGGGAGGAGGASGALSSATMGRIFHPIEDRYLLCLTHLHGYGNWELIRMSIRRCERFRFDYYLQSCSADAIGKRCELLMRAAEKELSEIERKKKAVELLTQAKLGEQSALASKAAISAKDAAGFSASRLTELTTMMSEESRKLAETRAQLARLTKGGNGDKSTITGASSTTAHYSGSGTASKGVDASKGEASLAGGHAKLVPESLLPELCKLIIQTGAGSVAKVVNVFVERHPLISKRQCEMKISELALKDKRGSETQKIWYLHKECEHYLTMDNAADGSASNKNTPKGKVAAPTSAKRKSTDSLAATSSSSPTPLGTKTPTASSGKRKRDSSGGESQTPKTATKKRASTGAADTPTTSGDVPKKFKRAFGFWIKTSRPSVEAELAKELNASSVPTEVLKQKLLELWEAMTTVARAPFEKKEAEDKARYDREMAIYKQG